ncbi:MAG: acyl carrier protein [Halothiobacillaceae bacterium]|nr:acyl carrier protein [Halothiobacillaceae bacterium]HER35564.1 acyl carrier protein [Halothiobacillaceae bacterium]
MAAGGRHDPLFDQVRGVIVQTLDLPGPKQRFTPDSGLFGEIPELDSMGVVLLLTALEDRFDIQLSDDEIDAEWFATFGSVTEFIRPRVDKAE